MHLRSLIHLIGAVKGLVQPQSLLILGSSSLLALDGSLGDEGQPLEITMDVDLLVVPCDPGAADVLHEAVGENSMFHREFGVYADILNPDIAETLPAGWQNRIVPFAGFSDVKCLEAVDLALVKLSLGRKKDMALVNALVKKGLITVPAIRERYQQVPMNENQLYTVGKNLNAIQPV